MIRAQISAADVARAVRPLREFDKKVRRRVSSKIARAGGKVQLDELKRRMPKNRGLLRRSLAQKLKTYPDAAVSIDGQKKGAAYPKTKYKAHGGISSRGYAPPLHLAIGATRPHRIPGRLRWGLQTRGKKLAGKAMTLPGGFARSVKHPGKKANPVFEVAARSSQAPAIAACVAIAKLEVEREANLARWD